MTKPLEIPDRWLQGCCLTLKRREGLDGMQALRRAVEIWRQQEQPKAASRGPRLGRSLRRMNPTS